MGSPSPMHGSGPPGTLSAGTLPPGLDAGTLARVARTVAGAEPLAAWVSGSHAQGVAHTRSDIDLYVLVDDRASGHSVPAVASTVASRVERGRTVECDLWAAQAVDAVLDSLAAIDPSCVSQSDVAAFDYQRLGLLHGLRIGVPVLGAAAFETLRRRCPGDRVTALIERRNRGRIAEMLDDAAGMQEAGNLLGACLRAREAVGIAFDTRLNRMGRVYINPKSRAGLIAGMGPVDGLPADLVAAYLAVESRLPEAAAGRDAYLERCRTLIDALLEHAVPAGAQAAPCGRKAGERPVVLTFGTFDLFHIGHLRIIERAASFGRLLVGVSSDELNRRKKGRYPLYSQEERMAIVASLACVDGVFLEESLERKREYLLCHGADMLVMGDDWQGRFDEFSDICRVLYLPRTPEVSTTSLIETIRALSHRP